MPAAVESAPSWPKVLDDLMYRGGCRRLRRNSADDPMYRGHDRAGAGCGRRLRLAKNFGRPHVPEGGVGVCARKCAGVAMRRQMVGKDRAPGRSGAPRPARAEKEE